MYLTVNTYPGLTWCLQSHNIADDIWIRLNISTFCMLTFISDAVRKKIFYFIFTNISKSRHKCWWLTPQYSMPLHIQALRTLYFRFFVLRRMRMLVVCVVRSSVLCCFGIAVMLDGRISIRSLLFNNIIRSQIRDEKMVCI